MVVLDCQVNEELKQEENWRGQLLKGSKRKRGSYLTKKSEWQHVDLNQKRDRVPIGILRNGNCADLKPVKIRTETIVLENTCGFDSVVQLICANYCDSELFERKFCLEKSRLLDLVQQVIKAVGYKAYLIRCNILNDIFDEKVALPSGIIKLSTACPIEALMRRLCLSEELQYSYEQTYSCNVCNKPRIIRQTLISINLVRDVEYHSLETSVKEYIDYSSRPVPCASPHCEEVVKGEITLNKAYIFVELLDSTGTNITRMKLADIPQSISVEDVVYFLGGVVAYSGNLDQTRSDTLGHFKAFCCRLNEQWEIYDDLTKSKAECSKQQEVIPHLLFYRI